MSESVRPHRWQPATLPSPWDSPGKNTGVGCHFLLQCMKVKSESEVAQSYPTLRNPMDCSPPGSSIHGICQARVLEWVAIAFSGWWLVNSKNLFLLVLEVWKSQVKELADLRAWQEACFLVHRPSSRCVLTWWKQGRSSHISSIRLLTQLLT